MALIRAGKGSKGAGKSSGGKGKGKGGGQWVFLPVQTSFVKSSFGKGGKKGGRKGGKKGAGKNREPRTSFAELSDERKEEIRARHEEKHAEQGRVEVDDTIHTGELLQRGKRYGWIKPAAFGKLPSEVQEKVKEMVKAKRAKAKETQSNNDVFKQNVLFVHMSDVVEGVKVDTGDRVKFKVYTDDEGAGAYEVKK